MALSRFRLRQLDRIAAELMADKQIAAVVGLFAVEPDPAACGRPSALLRRHDRLAGFALVAVTLVAVGLVGACLALAEITGARVFLTGFVLVVPTFVLFGRCCHRYAHHDGVIVHAPGLARRSMR